MNEMGLAMPQVPAGIEDASARFILLLWVNASYEKAVTFDEMAALIERAIDTIRRELTGRA